jgi:hypothetical protein
MSQTHRKTRRELFTKNITEQIRLAIRNELESAPSSLTHEDRAAIEDEILSHTSRVLDALSSAEMTSEGALLSHIANARYEAHLLIRDRRPPSRPGAVAVKTA